MIETKSPLESPLLALLAPFVEPQRIRFEKALLNYLAVSYPPNSGALSDAIAYSLTGSAKRFRPALLYLFGDSIGLKKGVDDLALAVEFFHTASLIADDLPSMDNDVLRRGRPALHIAFEEKTALLASFSLIAEGNRLLAEGGQERAGLLVSEAGRQTGPFGTCLGQHLDLLRRKPGDKPSVEELLVIHEKKTGALFSLSFTLPWILAREESHPLSLVREAAFHFGLAFQIMDDLSDAEEDLQKGNPINIAGVIGKEAAYSLFKREMALFLHKIEKLSVRQGPLGELTSAIHSFIADV